MEEKQLDFNAPLLSVRRFTSTAAFGIEGSKRVEKSPAKKPSLPPYKPGLKSGPVRTAGKVPFLWEQIPGRPKDGCGLCQNTPELAHLTPKLPPGKIVDSKQPSSAKDTVDKEPEVLTLSKLTQADNLTDHADDFSSNGNVSHVTSSDRSQRSVVEDHTSNLKDCDDEAFSDALDTLSHTESFFMNCSLTGLSAPDSPEMKPSRSTSIDPQAWNFMMDRFLPAAKAMASESPQYASRKQPVAREPVRLMRQVKNGDGDRQPLTFRGDEQPLHYQYKPYVAPQHSMDEEEKNSSDDDEDFDDTDNLTVKACGILPRFCLNNSLCLLNPVPGIKIRSRMPSSSIRHKVTTYKKNLGPENLSGPDPETWEAVYKHKLLGGLQPPVTSDDGSKPTSESNQIICWSDSQTPDGSSPYRPSSSDGITPYRREASQSPFHEGMSFLGVPKQGENRKAVGLTMYVEGQNDDCRILSHQSSKQGSGSSSPVTEKTLHIDSVHLMGTSNSRSGSPDIKELMCSAEKDSRLLLESERFRKCSRERDSLQPRIFEISESNPLSFSEGSILSLSMDNRESFRHDDGLVQEANSLECSDVLTNRSLGFNRPAPLEEDQGNSYAFSLQSPCPPPLPRSPSESWLCRTLPSVSSMNPSSRSYLGVQFHSRKQLLKESPVDPKWETIVKTENAQHRHSRFSEELKITASHASGT